MKSLLRPIYHKFLKRKKLKQVKQGGNITVDQLIKDFENLGIKPGDQVFVHSSLSKLGFVDEGPEGVINALKAVISEEGTLLFPAFGFAGGGVYGTLTKPGYVFDPEEERSYVGKISDVFWRQKDVLRSIHPTHSVAAWGKNAAEYVKDHVNLSSNWGEGTPFGKMLENNVKMIGLGVPLPMFTFFHCAEDYNLELFPGLYAADKIEVTVKEGSELKKYLLPYHDPEFLTDRIELNPEIAAYFTNHFLQSEKLIEGKIGNAETLLIHAKDFYDLTIALAKQGKTIYKV